MQHLINSLSNNTILIDSLRTFADDIRLIDQRDAKKSTAIRLLIEVRDFQNKGLKEVSLYIDNAGLLINELIGINELSPLCDS